MKSLTIALTAVVSLAPLSAYAQSSCPPGSWFCADGQAGAAAPAAAPAAPAAPVPAPAGSGTLAPLPPPQAGTTVVVQQQNTAPPPAAAPVAPTPAVVLQAPSVTTVRKEWGINLHLSGVMMGSARENRRDSGMIGLGGALRYRPSPKYAVEGSLDAFGGKDYYGNTRSEGALSFNGYYFFNTRSSFQPYLFTGFGFAWARVEVSDRSYLVAQSGPDISGYSLVNNFSYFGVHVGGGAEWRVARNLAFNADLKFFVRGRTNTHTGPRYEYVASDGRATNTSGGGLLTIGGTLYF